MVTDVPDVVILGEAIDQTSLADQLSFEAPSVVLICLDQDQPITELIQRVLGVEPVLMGFGLPDDNLHAPNEHFAVEQFERGAVASAAMLHNLARLA